MISCESFRNRFAPNSEDASLLEHLRSCDRCLDHAAAIDPDVMFRALGGEEMTPPGGVDAFVTSVMQQVRVRAAEGRVEHRSHSPWTRRLAIAATLAVGITGATLVYRTDAPAVVNPSPVRIARAIAPVSQARLTTKPIVQTYQSGDTSNATIVEVPSEGAEDVQIVMIFDENLPADL